MPQPGDFFVTATNSLVGKAIRLFTHSKVNHAGVLIDPETVVEAQPRGAQKAPASKYPNAKWSSVSLTDTQRAVVVQWSTDHVGTPYNFLDIAALFFSRVLHIKFGWVNRRLSSNGTDICSQLVDAAYRAAGVNLFTDNRPTGDVTPEDLDEVIDG